MDVMGDVNIWSSSVVQTRAADPFKKVSQTICGYSSSFNWALSIPKERILNPPLDFKFKIYPNQNSYVNDVPYKPVKKLRQEPSF